MALVSRKIKQNALLTAGNMLANYFQNNPGSEQAARAMVRSVGNRALQTLTGSGTSFPVDYAPRRLGNGNGVPKRQKKGGGRSRRSSISRGVYSNPDSSRVTCHFLMPVANTATLVSSNYVFFGNDNATNFDMKSLSTTWNAIQGAYEFFRIQRIRVEYIPQAASTSAGAIALGFDSDVNHTFASGVTAITHRRSVFSDYKSRCSLEWVPTMESERESKLLSTVTTPARNYAPCVLQWYCSNDNAGTSATIGYLEIYIDVIMEKLI
jgi:hypothetical protein